MLRFFIKPSSGSHSCLLKLLIVRYYFSKYADSMSYFIVMSSDFMLLVFLALTSCFSACRAWHDSCFITFLIINVSTLILCDLQVHVFVK